MKRVDLIRAIEQFGCVLIRHGRSMIGFAIRVPAYHSLYRGIARSRNIWPDTSSANCRSMKMRTAPIERSYANHRTKSGYKIVSSLSQSTRHASAVSHRIARKDPPIVLNRKSFLPERTFAAKANRGESPVPSTSPRSCSFRLDRSLVAAGREVLLGKQDLQNAGDYRRS